MNYERNVAQISDDMVNNMKLSLVIEYCYGIIRYRVIGRSLTPINLRMKIIAVIITLLWISIATIVCIVPKVKVLVNERDVLGNLIFTLHWIAAVLQFALTNFAVIFFHAQDNQKVLEILANIDISLHVRMNDSFYKNSSSECKKLFVIFILFCILMATVTILLQGQIDILFSAIYFARKIEIILFCEMMFFLRQRLELMKKYFIKFISDRNQRMTYATTMLKKDKSDKCYNFIGQVSDRNNKILDLASAFINVGEAFKMINDIYNLIILMAIVSAFVFILIVFWSSLSLVKIKNNDKFLLNLLTTTYWNIGEVSSIIFISYYCEKVLEAREEIKTSLKNMVIYHDLPKNMRQQTKMFIELTEIWEMDFNVFEMFEVNKKLVLKFISICTSYVIVLIQISGLL
ncbi:uncharacterized protein [Battus philenor]|uniref:uncharacterized protein n=1 Tax=Battus philenor TaxID=42288 RepID=UPI0035D0FAD5